MDGLLQMLRMVPGIVIAFSFHEWGHAYAAYKMGDPTARNLGRMTINPIAHIDPMGFLMMVIVGFGWAKPVPVNANNYRNYKKGELVVSLAGVTMNFILAIVGTIAFVLMLKAGADNELSGAFNTAADMLLGFITFNIALMVFNLIPVFPLDGFHVAEVLLSKVIGPEVFIFLRNYGQFILIGILLLSRLGYSFVGTISTWICSMIITLALTLFGMN